MREPEPETIERLKLEIAANRVLLAGLRVVMALKHNPYCQLQPRVLSGNPGAGEWTLGGALISGAASILPVLQRVGLAALPAFRETARRISPTLRRLPRRWDDDLPVPSEDDFDVETRRIGPPSWNRFSYPTIRFRSERELREYLGPAGAGREWHHIVEKRLAENGLFRPNRSTTQTTSSAYRLTCIAG